MRPRAAALLVALLLVAGALGLVLGREPEGGRLSLLETGPTSFDASIVSFDGVRIEATVYRPAGADASRPVPVVLHGHGWSGSRTTDGAGIVGRLWMEGFGVVSIDARGHGASGGVATVQHRDHEVQDSRRVLDWVHDNLDWVRREPASGVPKDVVAGAVGASYGGGFQLMLASHDARLDAIAPEIAWSDLNAALAPNGVPKSVWSDVLIGQAHARGTRFDPRIEQWHARRSSRTSTRPKRARTSRTRRRASTPSARRRSSCRA